LTTDAIVTEDPLSDNRISQASIALTDQKAFDWILKAEASKIMNIRRMGIGVWVAANLIMEKNLIIEVN